MYHNVKILDEGFVSVISLFEKVLFTQEGNFTFVTRLESSFVTGVSV